MASRVVTKVRVYLSKGRLCTEGFVTECYHGGRNESFIMGPTNRDQWIDLDISGAYTHAMVALKPLDYDKFEQSRDANDFCGDVCGFAWVDFKFPEDERFPSLPVRTETYGLYYPLSGTSLCTAPEIENALRCGAELTIKIGVIIPWKIDPTKTEDGQRIFLSFVRLVKEKRASFPKGSIEELFWKELGNSAYGKMAQGLKEKRVFDTKYGINKTVGHSAISNPMYAAHTTGLIRAVLSEMMNSVPKNRTIVSVTTDGFLTNAMRCEVDTTGVLCKRFQYYCDLVSGRENTSILELKHRVNRVLAMKTRGQATLDKPADETVLLAKAGVKPPVAKEQHNQYMIELYFNRQPGQVVAETQLMSTREQWLTERDLIPIERVKRLNLEYDFKRKLVNPRMVRTHLGVHLAMDSVPWQTVEQGERYRAIFDGWRRKNVLKTVDDWDRWTEYHLLQAATPRGCGIVATDNNNPVTLFWRVIIRGFVHQRYGLEHSRTYKELAAYLAEVGYPTNVNELKRAKQGEVPFHAVPAVGSVIPLLKRVLMDYPNLRWQDIFVVDHHSLVMEKI